MARPRVPWCMSPIEHFIHCPRCGVRLTPRCQPNSIQCAACGLLLFFNPTVAVAGLIRGGDQRLLFLRRAKEPAKGKLAVPGGFVDFGETAEAALARETREEVGLEPAGLRFFCSHVNSYAYQGVTYPVLDLFFIARVAPDARPLALDGVADVCWLDPMQLDLDEIAFPSIRRAIEQYREVLGATDQ